jgi:hypothetical protein
MAKVIPLKAKSSSGKRQAMPLGYREYRRPKLRWHTYAIACVVAIAALIVIGGFLPKVTGARSVKAISAADLRVIDGDTVFISGKRYRLVGFDTPETMRAKCDSERARRSSSSSFADVDNFRGDHSSGNSLLVRAWNQRHALLQLWPPMRHLTA